MPLLKMASSTAVSAIDGANREIQITGEKVTFRLRDWQVGAPPAHSSCGIELCLLTSSAHRANSTENGSRSSENPDYRRRLWRSVYGSRSIQIVRDDPRQRPRSFPLQANAVRVPERRGRGVAYRARLQRTVGR